MYTPDELETIQAGMDEMMELAAMSPERKAALAEAHQQGLPLRAFLPLAIDKPELYAKVTGDPRVEKFRVLAFLPKTAPLVFDSSTEPVISVFDGTRGQVIRMQHPDGDYIIKPYQSTNERTIAPRVGELGIGPKQFASTRNLMTEEFVSGAPTTKLGGEDLTPERTTEIGRQLGLTFTALHRGNIFYNDTLNDDFGKSHVVVGADGKLRLIDFGVALDMDDSSRFTDEQVWNYLRTYAEISAFWDGSREYADEMVRTHGDAVRRATPTQMVDRQISLIQESLGTLSSRIGGEAVQNIWRGFQETYIE